MKKTLLISVFAFCNYLAFGQHNIALTFSGGISTINNIQTEGTLIDGYIYSGKSSYSIGTKYIYAADSNISHLISPFIGVRLLNTSNTFENPPDFPTQIDPVTLRLYYLEIPLGVDINIYKNIKLNLSYNYLIRTRINNKDNFGSFFYMDYQGTYSEQMIQGGISYSFKRFTIGVNYGKTLTPIRKSELWASLGNEHYQKIKNISFNYSIFSSK